MSIEEEELGDDVAEMIGCLTDESLLRTPSTNATPTVPLAAKLQRVNEASQCFIIYPLSYEALQRFVEALIVT